MNDDYAPDFAPDDFPMPDLDMDAFINTKLTPPSKEDIDKNILDALNPEQRAAAMIINGPLRILAGAGTGKTKTVIHRIAYMINNGINPSSILAITFTNKAAQEFQNRLCALIPPQQAYGVNCGTIHSIFARLLREYADRLGYDDHYAIVDETDANNIIKMSIAEAIYGDPEAKVDRKFVSEITDQICFIKSEIFYRDELDELCDDNKITPDGIKVYNHYQQYLKTHNMMDFDDLLLNMYDLLTNNSDVLRDLQNRFTHIIVDEYQDTSNLQDASIKMIAAGHHNLCVIGDDDQSIYAWRGADPKLMLNFTDDYPNTAEVILEENYRSSPVILNAANQVISHNKVRLGKNLRTSDTTQIPIQLKRCRNSFDQAEYVANEIIKHHDAGIPYSEMAILYRLNYSSGAIEKELGKHSIPYELYRGTAFFAHESVKDIISYAKLLISGGRETDLALERIINKPARGISPKKLEQIKAGAEAYNVSLIKMVKEISEKSTDVKLKGLCADFLNIFKTAYSMLCANANIGEILTELYMSSGYMSALTDRKDSHSGDRLEKDISDEENVNECINMAFEFDKLHRGSPDLPDKSDNSKDILRMFLEYATLSADSKQDPNADCVQMMTMHKAKGLEFKCVFAIDLCDDIIPSKRDKSMNNEEERRLMYVTITRAKTFLHLSYPIVRRMYGENTTCDKSPFINEIDPKLMKSVK